MSVIILEAIVNQDDINIEDGGRAVIAEPQFKTVEGDNSVFVRIQSWTEKSNGRSMQELLAGEQHESIKSIIGKKIRVTVEVLD